MNIDTLLITIINHNDDALLNSISDRDYRVLHSLAKSILHPTYITEKQSNLLLRLLKDNVTSIRAIDARIDTAINLPNWSKPFRLVDRTKRMYIKYSSDLPIIQFEFTFTGQLKRVFQTLQKHAPDLLLSQVNKTYTAEFSEKNIVLFVNELSKYQFDIDKKIKEHYDTITSWNYDEFKDQYLISTINYPNFQKQLASDLGINTPLTLNLLADRSNRYQYFTQKLSHPETLTEKIAHRTSTKLWVDSTVYSVNDILKSLIELKRLPVMFVFDALDVKRCTTDLKQIIEALNSNGITTGIGIYFRLPNENGKCEFNQLIADNQYNCQLDTTTQVVGVQSGKIPKFFLKEEWKPMSIISIQNSLKHTKTSVYANCCDLIITHTPDEPLIESRALWR